MYCEHNNCFYVDLVVEPYGKHKLFNSYLQRHLCVCANDCFIRKHNGQHLSRPKWPYADVANISNRTAKRMRSLSGVSLFVNNLVLGDFIDQTFGSCLWWVKSVVFLRQLPTGLNMSPQIKKFPYYSVIAQGKYRCSYIPMTQKLHCLIENCF